MGGWLDTEPFAHAPRDSHRGVPHRGGWWVVARGGEGVDPLELLVDRPGEGERIQAVALPPQLRCHARVDLRASEHPFEGRARRVVAPPNSGPDPLLAHELDRGQEEVLEEPELVPVEGIDGGAGLGGVVAHVAQELADVGPVLLLDGALSSFL